MCDTEIETEIDGTVTAFCYCGWAEYGHNTETANAAAHAHENALDVIDADAFTAAAV
ncbi:hypothetical protein SK571_30820 [Lentzea sp. BCCO 10_0798]|uniref:Uncharacterized protein n=1 Tax=Lentzea kristufekii TaxID=3095430 RepID=A0ABU4TZN3_9PSEU|nr:hypothetical protein [Lentzea sp. BCCO 10_0798]MDX8053783.1 hypothetical protein [Lentzea sp. BCCO 10_0798]